jgi:hypothetical protein
MSITNVGYDGVNLCWFWISSCEQCNKNFFNKLQEIVWPFEQQSASEEEICL